MSSLEPRVSSKENQYCTVADPDLQIRGEGGSGLPDSEIRRGAGLKNIFFGPYDRASFWSKNKRGQAP